MNDKTEFIGRSLASFIDNKGIVARCELLQRIYQLIRENELNDAEKSKIQDLVGKTKLAPGIFSSIVNGKPIFQDFPVLDSFIVIDERIFHFGKANNFKKADFQRAIEDLQERSKDLSSLVVRNLQGMIFDFMSDCGYDLKSSDQDEMRFTKDGEDWAVLTYSRITHVDPSRCMACANDNPMHCIVVVPHEECIPPFMNFFINNVEGFEEAGIQVWVANMEEGSIDPFIGFTEDLDVYSSFKNPRLASQVRSTWKV